MLYYKVIVPDKVYRFKHWLETIPDELFTPSELRRYSQPDKHGYCLRRKWLEEINISPRSTYWLFGARFHY